MKYVPPAERDAEIGAVPDSHGSFPCNTCGETFPTREAVRDHAYSAHSYRWMAPKNRPHNRGPIACGHPGCDYSFNNETGAAQHREAKHGA